MVHKIVNQLHDPYVLDYYILPMCVIVIIFFLYLILSRFQKKEVKKVSFKLTRPKDSKSQ